MTPPILLRSITPDKGRTWRGTGTLRIGRLRDLEIVLEEDSVSRFHAEICPDERGWEVVDRGSTNGTYLNGERLTAEPRCLRIRDIVQFGKAAFLVANTGTTVAEETEPNFTGSHVRVALDRAGKWESWFLDEPTVERVHGRSFLTGPPTDTAPEDRCWFWRGTRVSVCWDQVKMYSTEPTNKTNTHNFGSAYVPSAPELTFTGSSVNVLLENAPEKLEWWSLDEPIFELQHGRLFLVGNVTGRNRRGSLCWDRVLIYYTKQLFKENDDSSIDHPIIVDSDR